MGHEKNAKHIKPEGRFDQLLLVNSSQFFSGHKQPVFIFDPTGKFIFFNKAAENFLGYKSSEVIGKHFRMLLTLDDLSDGFLFLYQTLHGCYTEHSLFRFRLQDGSTRVVGITAGPIYHDDKVRAALAIAHDSKGKESNNPQDTERVRIFKKFSEDLHRWSETSGK